MAPQKTPEHELRAAAWQAMHTYALQIAREHIGRRVPVAQPDEEPTRITRNIGPVHTRKMRKVQA